MHNEVGVREANPNPNRMSGSRELNSMSAFPGETTPVVSARVPVETIQPSSFLQKSSFEYLFYVGTLILAVTYWGLYDMVVVSRDHFEGLRAYTQPAWIPFRWLGSLGMDCADYQWYYFTVAIPFAAPFMTLYLFISSRLRRRARGADAKSLHVLHVVTGLGLAFGISGPGFVYALLLIIGNFYILAPLHRRVPFVVFMGIMWITHICILFLNHQCSGYGFAWLGLDSLHSIQPPLIVWTVHYNMSVLRMIAFNTDFCEAVSGAAGLEEKVSKKHDMTCIECAQIREVDSNKEVLPGGTGGHRMGDALRCYKYRTECPRHPGEYHLLGYLGYVFYPTLYIAGPMSSYNAYISQVYEPTRAHDRAKVRKYGFRTLLNFLLMFIVSHYLYVTAISFDTQVFSALCLSRRMVVLFLSLGSLWLKFNCVWKLFRFLSILDGFDVPEDMRRCFTNTVNIQGFWRDWHASFNLWIVRYMYIPMGGSKKKHLTIFPIFFFIAIWHDIELRLLYWAGIMCLCFIPEILVTQILMHPKGIIGIKLKRHPTFYLYLRAVGTTIGMFELIIGNLIGFRISAGGVTEMLKSLWTESSVMLRVITIVFFYFGASIAIQDRDQVAYDEQQNRIKYGLSKRITPAQNAQSSIHQLRQSAGSMQSKDDVHISLTEVHVDRRCK